MIPTPEFSHPVLKMKVKVNGLICELENGSALAALMKQLSLEQKSGIAIAVNEKVIPKKQWQELVLSENDQVIIIEAAQGG